MFSGGEAHLKIHQSSSKRRTEAGAYSDCGVPQGPCKGHQQVQSCFLLSEFSNLLMKYSYVSGNFGSVSPFDAE